RGRRVDRQHKLPALVGSSAQLFNFNGTVRGRMQPQIGQVSFGKPCPDLLHTTKDLGKANAMCEQVRDLPGACQIPKPEQAASRVEQTEPDKLVDSAAGELAQ